MWIAFRIIFLFLRNTLNDLYYDADQAGIVYKIQQLKDSTIDVNNHLLSSTIDTLSIHFQSVIDQPKTYRLYIPTIQWYGLDNQYHTWMFGDYPWFSSVDSSAHYTLDSISKQIIALRPVESSINYEISKKKRELQENSTGAVELNQTGIPVNTKLQLRQQMDSLKQIKSQITSKIQVLLSAKTSG